MRTTSQIRKGEMKPEQVKSMAELVTYIREHAERILVKVMCNGAIGTVPLASLPDAVRSQKELDFLSEKVVPYRMLTREEARDLTVANLATGTEVSGLSKENSNGK